MVDERERLTVHLRPLLTGYIYLSSDGGDKSDLVLVKCHRVRPGGPAGESREERRVVRDPRTFVVACGETLLSC